MTGGVFRGIDPGREKFGFAVATDERLLFAAIVPFARLDAALPCLLSGDSAPLSEWRTEGEPYRQPTGLVFLGDGTSHAEYEHRLSAAGVAYSLTDERMTTLAARGLYWKLHPPAGLSRLLPLSWRTPPRAIDDLAAWAIIGRALGKSYKIGNSF